jgi:hypothetical protein
MPFCGSGSKRDSATDSGLQMRGVAVSLHRDLGDGAVDFAEIVGRERHGSRPIRERDILAAASRAVAALSR